MEQMSADTSVHNIMLHRFDLVWLWARRRYGHWQKVIFYSYCCSSILFEHLFVEKNAHTNFISPLKILLNVKSQNALYQPSYNRKWKTATKTCFCCLFWAIFLNEARTTQWNKYNAIKNIKNNAFPLSRFVLCLALSCVGLAWLCDKQENGSPIE